MPNTKAEYGYELLQVTGKSLDPRDFPNVSQRMNIGGEHVGVVGSIFRCDWPGQPHVMTTMTYPTATQADQAVERWLNRLYRPDLG